MLLGDPGMATPVSLPKDSLRPRMAEKSAGFRKFKDEVVIAQTGKSTLEWNSILDKWGMREKGHTLTAKHLQQAYNLSP